MAGLVEMPPLEEGRHTERVGIGGHDRIEEEVHFQGARVLVADPVLLEWLEHGDAYAVGPFEVAHVSCGPLRQLQPLIVGVIGQVPRVRPGAVPNPGAAVAQVRVGSGLAVRPPAHVAFGHIPGEPTGLGLPPAIGEGLVVEVVVLGAERRVLACRPTAWQGRGPSRRSCQWGPVAVRQHAHS